MANLDKTLHKFNGDTAWDKMIGQIDPNYVSELQMAKAVEFKPYEFVVTHGVNFSERTTYAALTAAQIFSIFAFLAMTIGPLVRVETDRE